MNKDLKIDLILSKVKEKIEELDSYQDPEIEVMTAEEMVLLAMNLVTFGQVTQDYTMPVGIVDRTQVTFALDEDIEFDIGDKEHEN